MKKKDILKAIGIVLGIFVVLTWLIPTGSFSGTNVTTETTDPIGLLDIFKYPIQTVLTSIFITSALVVLLIGGLYGVINKTGVYSNIVEGLAKKFKGKEKNFLIITILVLGILSSLTGLVLPLFILVPFFAAVILTLGYNKLTAMLSTVGAILVGNLGSTYAFNINGYIVYFFQNKINDSIWFRLGLFALVIVSLIIFVVKTAKIEKKKTTKKATKSETKKTTKSETKEEIVIPLYEKNVDKKQSPTALVVICAITLVATLVGMFNWESVLNVKLFTNIYDTITKFELNGYPLFANILGNIDPMGYWTNTEFCMLIVIAILLIKWLYNIKLSDAFEGFVNGVKEMVPVAIYVFIANILFFIINSHVGDSGSTIFPTIANFFLSMTKKFNVLTFGFASIVGSILYNDFPYMVNSLLEPINSLTKDYALVGMLTQGVHGLVMLVAPTSVILVIGLKYFDVSYKEWFKNIWKYLLIALIAVIIIITIMVLV